MHILIVIFISIIVLVVHATDSTKCIEFSNVCLGGFGAQLLCSLFQLQVRNHGYEWSYANRGLFHRGFEGKDADIHGISDVYSEYPIFENCDDAISSGFQNYSDYYQMKKIPNAQNSLNFAPNNLFYSLKDQLHHLQQFMKTKLQNALPKEMDQPCIGVHLRQKVGKNDYRKKSPINPYPISPMYMANTVLETALIGGIDEIFVMSDDYDSANIFAEHLTNITTKPLNIHMLDREELNFVAIEKFWLDIHKLSTCRVVVGSFASQPMQIMQLLRSNPWDGFLDVQGFGWSGFVHNHLISGTSFDVSNLDFSPREKFSK